MTKYNRRGRRPACAFTIIELLVVIGVIMILIALAIPSIQSARSASLAAKNMSNVRQMALGLSQYAATFRDEPPVFGTPDRPQAPWEFDFGKIGRGEWFEHKWLAPLSIQEFLGSSACAIAPGRPSDLPMKRGVHGGVWVQVSDYSVTNTLYARPDFFDATTQAGPSQFGVQKLSSIAYPSDKGLISQGWMFHFPKYGPVLACCVADVASPIAFADLSASEHVMRRMPPGVGNPYSSLWVAPGFDPLRHPGVPVVDTLHGILGRDR